MTAWYLRIFSLYRTLYRVGEDSEWQRQVCNGDAGSKVGVATSQKLPADVESKSKQSVDRDVEWIGAPKSKSGATKTGLLRTSQSDLNKKNLNYNKNLNCSTCIHLSILLIYYTTLLYIERKEENSEELILESFNSFLKVV